MRHAATATAAALLCAALCGRATAGVAITIDNTGGGTPHTETILLDGDRMKTDAEHAAMIWRGDLQKMWMLDAERHSYQELDPATMQQMRAQMSEALKRMQQQMQSLPEAQRKQMEAMMAQQGMAPPGAAAAPPPTMTYEKAGDTMRVGTWSCTPYRVVVNGASNQELCIARLADVGLARDDLKALTSLSAFAAQMNPGAGPTPGSSAIDLDAMAKAIGYEGLPIRVTHRGTDGKTTSEDTVTAIERKTVAANTFDLPEGYTKEDHGGMGGGGGALPPPK